LRGNARENDRGEKQIRLPLIRFVKAGGEEKESEMERVEAFSFQKTWNFS